MWGEYQVQNHNWLETLELASAGGVMLSRTHSKLNRGYT